MSPRLRANCISIRSLGDCLGCVIIVQTWGVAMTVEAPRVLVVEDDRDFAESLLIALGTRNCQVEVAHTGEDAIRMFHEHCFDIAFMDIKLPGKNGVQSLAEILDF